MSIGVVRVQCVVMSANFWGFGGGGGGRGGSMSAHKIPPVSTILRVREDKKYTHKHDFVRPQAFLAILYL